MLVEFRMKNYKSFYDEMIFSMTPAPKQKGLDYSVLHEKVGTKDQKGLCSAVIYGPNASGKTHIISAMETFRAIILRGTIKNTDASVSGNVAASSLELIPNCQNKPSPVELGITFVEQGFLISYDLVMDLGGFVETNYPRKIIKETLVVNHKQVFCREDTLEVALPSVIRPLSNKSIKKISPNMKAIASSSLVDTDLFLTNGFRTIFATEFVDLITHWLSEKFMVIYSVDKVQAMQNFMSRNDNNLYMKKTLNEAIKEFGITSNDLGYRTNSNGENILCSIFKDQKIAIPADVFESHGTMKFMNEFPLVIKALVNGGTLVIDEFDGSIHPEVIMSIILAFHNDEINKHHAQLIFTTYNPIFLDASLLRRDEIKFVERNVQNNSIHYSLSDFKTASGVRKGEDYMSNYFVNRYGAIKDIDFSSILKDIMSDEVK